MSNIKTYSELISLPTFEQRYNYARLYGTVASDTFGGHRWINQEFYHSEEWRRIRDFVIVRDNGCDLAIPDRLIYDKPIVHHLNPISIDDLTDQSPLVFDPEYLILVSNNTHQAIHYGTERLLTRSNPIERVPGDTCPWK